MLRDVLSSPRPTKAPMTTIAPLLRLAWLALGVTISTTVPTNQEPEKAPTFSIDRPATQEPKPGYTDTPRLPNGWRVHDADRPRPPVVDPGPAPSAPLPVPADAIRLFDGSNLDATRGP